MNINNNFIATLTNQKTSFTPIWLMRQAGRYLPEYRAVREKAGSFLNLCKSPELASEVTLQPLKRFELDAAILFSDILVLPEAMGLNLNFVENEGPRFSNPILPNLANINNLILGEEVVTKLAYTFEAIKLTKANLNPSIPLIGFCGSPFTLACYMIEGQGSANYLKVKEFLYNYPALMHHLLKKITHNLILYLKKQVESGCDVVMIFDSWGGILSQDAYLSFSLPYINLILNEVASFKPDSEVPSIFFAKGRGDLLKDISKTRANCLGLDWTIELSSARKMLPNTILQGNFDPAILAVGDRNSIRREVYRILYNYKANNQGSFRGHIFNLGHGVLPMTNPDNVKYLVDLVHEVTSKDS